MKRIYNTSAFYLSLFCILISSYAIYANFNNAWLIAPPLYIILLLTITAFVLGIKGFKDKTNWWARLKSWLTVVLSFLLASILFLAFAFTSFFSAIGANEKIQEVPSPDGNYAIEVYRWDAGAAGSFGVRAELDGPLWFKKRIYYQRRIDQAEVEWKSNHVVTINNRTLNLEKGEIYGY